MQVYTQYYRQWGGGENWVRFSLQILNNFENLENARFFMLLDAKGGWVSPRAPPPPLFPLPLRS